MTAEEQNTKEAKSSLTDLTKIPEKDFEKEFRDWMERDGVARALQSKLRCDLIANFNRTSLGKRLMAETTNRLTLSSTFLALNTLVAEFLYAQDCHFTLSVFFTEVPFRNALPDFENERHFRFKEAEIFDIMKAICNTTTIDWNTKNKLAKKYLANTSTSLLFQIIQILLEKNAENMQKKINVGTNTQAESIFLENPQKAEGKQIQRDENAEFYNMNFRYLNKYLIILSRKVNEMTKQFEQKFSESGKRIRLLKSARNRKYEDLNRSLERVTANLKQMANAKRKSKYVDAIVQAIERLANQFQRCAANFDSISKNLGSPKQKTETRATQVESSSSTTIALLQPKQRPRTFAASQTDPTEKSYSDWLHEMRYTRNGQRFLDRVERSLRKAMDNQKRVLLLENEVRMRHQCELLRIRYKQKLLEQMCMNGGEHGESADEKQDLKASISEQFRQFELKHFDLLSKIYESEIESKPAASTEAKPDASAARKIPSYLQVDESHSCMEIDPFGLKTIPSSELFEKQQQQQQRQQPEKQQQQQQQQQNSVLPQSPLDIRQHIRDAVDEMAEEERNVNKIVHDAKMRIKELEQESDQITDNFLEYLERQRKQRLDARDAAQNLWNDYLNDNENVHVIDVNSIGSEAEKSKILENLRKQILYNPSEETKEGTTKRQNKKNNSNTESNSSSSHCTTYSRYKNPISKAKDDFFERERIFKQESERILSQQDATRMESDIVNTTIGGNKIDMPFELCVHEPTTKFKIPISSNSIMMAQLLNDSYNESSGSDINMLCRNTSDTIKTTAAKMFEENSSNSQEIQHDGGHRYGKSEMPTASKKQTAKIKIPTTTAMATTSIAFLTTNTTAMTLNKSNNNVKGRSRTGVSFVEAPPESSGSNTKSDFSQQNERNNDNHKSYYNNDNNNNNKHNSFAKPKESSSKNSIRNERKSLLQQSMARMQQLFSPHHQEQQQQQHHHQQQQNRQQQQRVQAVFDDNVLEDVVAERNEATLQDTMNKSNRTSMIGETQRNSNNQSIKVFAANSGSENVFSHYKNNFKKEETTEQVQQEQQTPRSIESIDNDDAITNATTNRAQQNDVTKTSSNNGNKAIEVRRDWHQIGYGTTSGRNAFKVNEATAKGTSTSKVVVALAVEEGTVVVTEEMNADCNVVEPGEIIEDDSNVAAVGTSPYGVLREQKKYEIGKLIESDDAAASAAVVADGNNFTSVAQQFSTSSSEELQFSHIDGGVGGGGDSGSVRRNGVGSSNKLLEVGSGSDSNSDFWA